MLTLSRRSTISPFIKPSASILCRPSGRHSMIGWIAMSDSPATVVTPAATMSPSVKLPRQPPNASPTVVAYGAPDFGTVSCSAPRLG